MDDGDGRWLAVACWPDLTQVQPSRAPIQRHVRAMAARMRREQWLNGAVDGGADCIV